MFTKQHCDITKVAPWQQVRLCMALLISEHMVDLAYNLFNPGLILYSSNAEKPVSQSHLDGKSIKH